MFLAGYITASNYGVSVTKEVCCMYLLSYSILLCYDGSQMSCFLRIPYYSFFPLTPYTASVFSKFLFCFFLLALASSKL